VLGVFGGFGQAFASYWAFFMFVLPLICTH